MKNDYKIKNNEGNRPLILHGMSEVAGQGINTVRGLRENGYEANMAVWSRNRGIKDRDIDLGINKSKKILFPYYSIKMVVFAISSLIKYDVLHSHYGYTLLPYCYDVFFHRLFNLKCFAEFHGSDIRFIYNETINYPYFKNNMPSKRTVAKTRRTRTRLLKHVNGIIVHDYELLPHLPNVNKPVYIVPLRVDVRAITPCYSDNGNRVPVIVHAPSNRSTKGTERILKMLESVKGEYELVLIENKSHEEALELYKSADIIVDQISVGTYGVFAIEAMAMGKPVITYISPEMKELLPEELPIISSDFDQLPFVIDRLIADPQLRHEYGIKGRQYAEKYHDHIKITKHLIDIYNGQIKERDLFKLINKEEGNEVKDV